MFIPDIFFRIEFMTLGALIAKARKEAGLSVEDIVASTNLRATLIHEIEKNDFSHCGGQTYARGHVRNIAHALHADEKEFVRIFDEEQSEAGRSIQSLVVKNNILRHPRGKRKISWKALLVISFACLGIAGLIQILISNISPSGVSALNTKVSATPAASSSSASPKPSEQTTFSSGTGVEVVVNAARASSWLFVSDASGRTLFSGQLLRGESRTFTTDTRLDLKIGNAGGVNLQVNGKQIAPIGVDGAVVSVSYGADS